VRIRTTPTAGPIWICAKYVIVDVNVTETQALGRLRIIPHCNGVMTDFSLWEYDADFHTAHQFK